MNRRRRAVGLVALVLVTSATVLVVFEGLCSLIIVLREIRKPVYYLHENYHCQYDELLGWVNIPNFEDKNLFGPRVCLKTNSQGFRAKYDYSLKVPEGRTRIICSGDSFTLGYEVDNEKTWCQQLEALDPRLETINMGQAGYGVHQAYLWYMRDGVKLEHNIHLAAFITDDFYRMKESRYGGFGKPVVKLEKDDVVIKNTPVPRHSYAFYRLEEQLRRLSHFRFYELANAIGQKMYRQRESEYVLSDREVREVALRMFEKLDQTNKTKGSALVVVHLPEARDYFSYESDSWSKWLRVELGKKGIRVFDLIEEFRQLPEGEAHLWILGRHYSNRGNEGIAKMIYKKLFSSDETSIYPKVRSGDAK